MPPKSNLIASLFCLFLLLLSLPLIAGEVPQQPTGARKIVHHVVPSYPLLAKSTHTSGAVKLNVTVDRSGAPKAIEVVGGNPVLVKAAQDSVNKWKWVPAETDTTERVELRFQPD